MSPVNMSPISEVADEMSYDSVKSRVRTAARLDFTTDMSIDMSVREVDKLEESQKEYTGILSFIFVSQITKIILSNKNILSTKFQRM